MNVCVHSEPPVEFTKPLEDQTVEEAATATLECEVSRENAEVRWFRDGQEIRKTKKYEMIVDGRKRALVIQDCTLDDSRTYACDAKDFKTSCFLNVERTYRNGKWNEFCVKQTQVLMLKITSLSLYPQLHM